MSFTVGAAGMASELLAARLLAPYLGTSSVVWTALIGTVLVALALGYTVGGRLTDRGAGVGTLSVIGLMAATAIAAIVPLSHPLARFAATIDDVRLGALMAAMGLLFIPNFLLAAASPIMMRLTALSQSIGRSIGGVQAWAAIGSVAGTFAFGFWLTSFFSLQHLLVGVASVVASCVLPLVWHAARTRANAPRVMASLLCIAAPSVGLLDFFPHAAILQLTTSEQQYWLFDVVEAATSRPKRVLKSGRTGYQAQVYLDERGGTPMRYLSYFDLDRHFVPDMQRVLMIGGGGFVYPGQLLKLHPDLQIDVVELDAELAAVAERFFHWHPEPRVQQFTGDGRVFLNRTSTLYDLIYVDAFSDINVPFHLLTQEFFQLVAGRLTTKGACLLNFIARTQPEEDVLVAAVNATMATAFAKVIVLPHARVPGSAARNMTFIGLMDAQAAARQTTVAQHAAMLQAPLTQLARAAVLTDNFAPVERLADRAF